MGSLVLFLLGVAAPLAVAVTLMWQEERRRNYLKMRFERLDRDNRGLKLAMSEKLQQSAVPAPPAAPAFPVGSDAEREEILELSTKLANAGMLVDWLRLGTRAPEEAVGRLLGLNAEEAQQMQEIIATWSVPGVVAALDRLKDRLATISEMEMLWADPHDTGERDAGAMAERALWVFEPEYVVGEGGYELDGRLGAVARPSVGAALQNANQKEADPTLVLAFKGPRVIVGGEQQLQAWNNVRDLMRGGSIRERDPVDVYVIGGSVDEYEGNPRIEGRHRNVRITSYDYGQLLTRAKRLTFGLHDELKDVAPFLKFQREHIAAAQAEAVNEAAAEAAANVSDDPVRDADDGGDVVRDVEYAEDPRADTAATEEAAGDQVHGQTFTPRAASPIRGSAVVPRKDAAQ
jgi:hypothetical protein